MKFSNANSGDVMVFQASRLRCFVMFMGCSWIAAATAYWLLIPNKNDSSLLGPIVGFTIAAALWAFVLTRHRYDIILTADELEGPELGFLRIRRISVPIRSVDLPRSKKGSFLSNSFIRTIEGHKITVSLFHFSSKQVHEIFKQLEQKLGHQQA